MKPLRQKKRAILLGSQVEDKKVWKRLLAQLKIRSSDFLVGVDAGVWHWKELGYEPDFAVGDWDSLFKHAKQRQARNILRSVPHRTLEVRKDRSDLYCALEQVSRFKVKEVSCLGVTGGRPDHHLATLLDLAFFSDWFESLSVYSPEATYYFLSSRNRVLKGALLPFRQTVSLFALTPKVSGVSLKGFEYPLNHAILRPSSHGLSNSITASTGARIEIARGKLLVIVLRNPPT